MGSYLHCAKDLFINSQNYRLTPTINLAASGLDEICEVSLLLLCVTHPEVTCPLRSDQSNCVCQSFAS